MIDLVDNQMKVTHEIIELPEKTTAKTKIPMIKLINMFKQEN